MHLSNIFLLRAEVIVLMNGYSIKFPFEMEVDLFGVRILLTSSSIWSRMIWFCFCKSTPYAHRLLCLPNLDWQLNKSNQLLKRFKTFDIICQLLCEKNFCFPQYSIAFALWREKTCAANFTDCRWLPLTSKWSLLRRQFLNHRNLAQLALPKFVCLLIDYRR